MAAVEAEKTAMGVMVARAETVEAALKLQPESWAIKDSDREANSERERGLRFVARYGRPYMPLVNRWRGARK